MSAPLSARKAFGNVSNVKSFQTSLKHSIKSTLDISNKTNSKKAFNENDYIMPKGSTTKELKKTENFKEANPVDPLEEMIFCEKNEHFQNMTEDLFFDEALSMHFDDMPSYLQHNRPKLDLNWL